MEKHPSYIPLFLGFLLIISFLLSASFIGIISSAEPWILSFFLLALIGFFYLHPYKEIIHNAGVIVGLIQIIYFLVWGIIRKDPSGQTEEN
jgi:hypothetical protein